MNKEYQKEYFKEWYKNNKENHNLYMMQKVECKSCDKYICRNYLHRHKLTKNHIKKLKS
jgi:hypothetical protein